MPDGFLYSRVERLNPSRWDRKAVLSIGWSLPFLNIVGKQVKQLWQLATINRLAIYPFGESIVFNLIIPNPIGRFALLKVEYRSLSTLPLLADENTLTQANDRAEIGLLQ